jgi:hypothetical protein
VGGVGDQRLPDHDLPDLLLHRRGAVATEVVDRVVTSVTPLDAPEFYIVTVEDLFSRIEEAIDQGVDSLRVEYDSANGIPVDLAIDERFLVADEETFIEGLAVASLDREGRTEALAFGWNLVGWTGGAPVAEATASIAGSFDSLFGWDAVAEQSQNVGLGGEFVAGVPYTAVVNGVEAEFVMPSA